jgi:hypothetical protein
MLLYTHTRTFGTCTRAQCAKHVRTALKAIGVRTCTVTGSCDRQRGSSKIGLHALRLYCRHLHFGDALACVDHTALVEKL